MMASGKNPEAILFVWGPSPVDISIPSQNSAPHVTMKDSSTMVM